MIIQRNIIPQIENHLHQPEITLITGARQVGKSTIMHILQDKLKDEGYATLFLNLDFETDYKYFASQQTLLKKISLEVGGEKIFVFIDEIQRKENAGLFLKGIYDKKRNIKLIASGSGSLELKEKIHESLAGRKRIFEIMPVRFDEFVNYSTGYKYKDKLRDYFDVEKDNTYIFLKEYLMYGGYPAIATSKTAEEKIMTMNEIFSSYVQKDISWLLNLERPDSFVKLIKWLSHTTGSGINYSTCAKDVGLSIPTLKKYLWYAEHTFIIKSISPFYKNKRKEITKSPVIYFTDTGLRNYAFGSYGNDIALENTGQAFESFIFTILYDLLKNTSHNIHYWRTTGMAEVDFIINAGLDIIPIEAKHKYIKDEKISRSFRSFIEKYKPAKAYIINLNYRNSIKVNNTKVNFIPFYDLFFEHILHQ